MKTFGTDPEFIIVKDGQPVSAINLLAGNIYNRVKLNGNEYYSDNVLAEVAVKPAKTQKEAVENIRKCLADLSDMVDPAQISNICAARYPKPELECDCEGEHHLCAKHVGCDPDTCAYRMAIVEGPAALMEASDLRTAGGHIHLGGSGVSLDGGEQTYRLIYMLDLLLCIPSLWMEVEGGLHKERRSLYGQAGRYRNKDYGIEYRSLSNFWLRSPKLVKMVYKVCQFAMDFVDKGKADEFYTFDMDTFVETQGDGLKAWKFNEYSREELVRCINESDKDRAAKFFYLAMDILGSKLATEVQSCIESRETEIDRAWRL